MRKKLHRNSGNTYQIAYDQVQIKFDEGDWKNELVMVNQRTQSF